MKKSNLIICFLCLTIGNFAYSRVRDLYITPTKMGLINLKMGQSTILRFTEKPKKIVIGNQNYFNVEFIENDVTIQPLGIAQTNIFVYGEYNTYGLILNVINHKYYDDLVLIKRGTKPSTLKRKIKSKKKVKTKFKLEHTIEGKIQIESNNFQYHDYLKLYILDIAILNLKKEKIKSENFKFELKSANKAYGEIKYIFDQKNIPYKLNARIFIKVPSTKSFSFIIKYKKSESKHLILEKYLLH